MNWLLTLEEYSKKVRTIRIPDYCEDFYRLGKQRLRCYYYYVYLDENLNTINPYTKKDGGKKVAHRFMSTFSREDAIEQSYNFIVKFAYENGLYDASVCDAEIARRQIEYLTTGAQPHK